MADPGGVDSAGSGQCTPRGNGRPQFDEGGDTTPRKPSKMSRAAGRRARRATAAAKSTTALAIAPGLVTLSPPAAEEAPAALACAAQAGNAAAKASDNAVTARLRKTRMCHFFKLGKCASAECSYAHSEGELREAPNLKKTKLCKSWSQTGSCAEGESCVYAHSESELRFTDGIYKSQMCHFFERGRCLKGDRCNHAHGAEDLRVPPARSAAGASRLQATPDAAGRGASGGMSCTTRSPLSPLRLADALDAEPAQIPGALGVPPVGGALHGLDAASFGAHAASAAASPYWAIPPWSLPPFPPSAAVAPGSPTPHSTPFHPSSPPERGTAAAAASVGFGATPLSATPLRGEHFWAARGGHAAWEEFAASVMPCDLSQRFASTDAVMPDLSQCLASMDSVVQDFAVDCKLTVGGGAHVDEVWAMPGSNEARRQQRHMHHI